MVLKNQSLLLYSELRQLCNMVITIKNYTHR